MRARRAAALALQEATAAVAEEHPGWPRFRAGVNTGEASVGVLGSGSGRTYSASATRSTSPRASRGSRPRAGSRSAPRRRPSCGAQTEPLGTVSVKGQAQPVEVPAAREAARELAARLTDPDAEHLGRATAAPHSSHSTANADGKGA